jgi:hypothetical protein
MLIANAFPFLSAYHRAAGFLDDAIEELAQRAWSDGVEPNAVLPRQNGTWATWREIDRALDSSLRAKILAELGHRSRTT